MITISLFPSILSSADTKSLHHCLTNQYFHLPRVTSISCSGLPGRRFPATPASLARIRGPGAKAGIFRNIGPSRCGSPHLGEGIVRDGTTNKLTHVSLREVMQQKHLTYIPKLCLLFLFPAPEMLSFSIEHGMQMRPSLLFE